MVSNTLVNYCKLPTIVTVTIVSYIMPMKWFLCSSVLSFERFLSTFVILFTKFWLRFDYINGALLILKVSSLVRAKNYLSSRQIGIPGSFFIIYLSVYLSIYLSICLSICLPIYLSIYLSICVSIYLYVYSHVFSENLVIFLEESNTK